MHCPMFKAQNLHLFDVDAALYFETRPRSGRASSVPDKRMASRVPCVGQVTMPVFRPVRVRFEPEAGPIAEKAEPSLPLPSLCLG
jgi:hypothetical protein